MALNANDLYVDLLYKLRSAPMQNSRNGMVKSMLTPTLFYMENPTQRVLFNPQRKANPYFHVMETVWMLGGGKEVGWLAQFNKGITRYAEANGEINGAYGHRWRKEWGRDQITGVVDELIRDPQTRQAVINMYDPSVDYQDHWADRPCNTTIYFRFVNGALNMTVCNRSNDVIWGAVGANIVHMTYLHELVARAADMPIGTYYVLSNNLHIYQQHWDLMDNPQSHDHYHAALDTTPYPILGENETLADLLLDCENFNKFQADGLYTTNWMNHVVLPMYEHYMCRLNGDYHTYDPKENHAKDWRLAESLWRKWHEPKEA